MQSREFVNERDFNILEKPSRRRPAEEMEYRIEIRRDGYAFILPEKIQMETLDVERRWVTGGIS